MRDRYKLTQRQWECLHAACYGPNLREAAEQLFIAENSIKATLRTVYWKLIASGGMSPDQSSIVGACMWLAREEYFHDLPPE